MIYVAEFGFKKSFKFTNNHLCALSYMVVLFYGASTLFGSFNAELSNFDKSFKQFSLV